MVLQALNLQQDALRNLNLALFGHDINFKDEYPELYEIRENRNNSIGHPTDRMNGKSFHHIGRSSIRKEGFTMISYFPKSGEQSKIEQINILSCIEIQASLLKKTLNNTMEKLKVDFDNHRNKFKNNLLADLIPADINYHFSKLYENTYKYYDIVEINFNIIEETYINLKDGIVIFPKNSYDY